MMNRELSKAACRPDRGRRSTPSRWRTLAAGSALLLAVLPMAYCAGSMPMPVFLPAQDPSPNVVSSPTSSPAPSPASGPASGRATGPTSRPAEPSVYGPSPARDRLPISIEVDGRFQDLVEVPVGLFDGGWTTNFTQSEIGGGTEPDRKRGKNLYPTGSLADLDLSRYLTAVAGAARTHVPPDATGVAALDFEGGLFPWAERGRDKYKENLTDAQFERLSHQFFLRSIRVAKATRPNAKWSFWGYPGSWHNESLIKRMADIYAEFDALTPSIYVRRSGDPAKIKDFVKGQGERVALVKAIHPRPDELIVAAYLWDHNAAVDHQRPRAKATIDDMLTSARAAEPWADQIILWVAAGSEGEAEQLNKSLAPGGHIRTFLEKYRSNPPPSGGE